MDSLRLIKGGAICISGTIPFAISGYIPEKLKIVPYIAGAGLESWGLWEIYKGFSSEGGRENIPAGELKDKIKNFKFDYPAEDWTTIDPGVLGYTKFLASYETTPEINDLNCSDWKGCAQIWGRIDDLDTGDMWKLVVNPFYPGMVPEVSRRLVLYYSESIPKFQLSAWIPNGCFWGRSGHKFQVGLFMSDTLAGEPTEEWWQLPRVPPAEDHLIALTGVYFNVK